MADRGHVIKGHGKPGWLNLIGLKLLACSTVLHPDAREQRTMRELTSLVDDKDLLIRMAVKEGMACLLYKNLLKSGALRILDPPQRDGLHSLYQRTVRYNLKLMRDLKEILQRLNQEKIHVVLMQGIALMQQIYHDIGLRPMTDIDLWVLQKDYSGLIRILSSLGYSRDPVYPNTFRRGSTTLDLHTHILWADRIKAHRMLIRKGQEDIYRNTQIIDFEGQEGRCLGQYDQVVYLCLHALKHHVGSLIWLVDIKNLIADWKRSDWEAFMDRARELGQEKTISYVFYLLLHLFGFQPPVVIDELLETKGPGFLERKVLRQRIEGDSLPIWAPVLLFSAGKGLERRLSLIFETLFPRPEILRQIFVASPDRTVWQLYFMRVMQLFGMVRMSLKSKVAA
jgi:hypothetical protein